MSYSTPYPAQDESSKTAFFGYRYAFNGMERDDEWNGVGNSYDFGARIYDARIAKFLSLDPEFRSFAGQSHYSFALNSPVRFIEIQGRYPGDVNVMILISEDYEESEITLEGDWTVIRATSLSEAHHLLSSNSEIGSVDNMFLLTHGSGAETESDDEEYMTLNGYQVDAPVIDDYLEGNGDARVIGELEALESISGYLADGSDLVFGACGIGASENMAKSIDSLVSRGKGNGNVNIYLNSTNTTFSVELDITESQNVNGGKEKNKLKSHKWVPKFDEMLVSDYWIEEEEGGFVLIGGDGTKLNLTIDDKNPWFSDIFNFDNTVTDE